jgi:fibronectin type 3 domain-containing protein
LPPTSYRIGVAEPEDSAFKTIAFGLTTPSYIDYSAMPGHTYRYVVTAVDANGESLASNEVAITLSKTKNSTKHILH